MVASRFQSGTTINLLVQLKANPDFKDDSGNAALHYAVNNQDIQAIEKLLTSLGPSPHHFDNKREWLRRRTPCRPLRKRINHALFSYQRQQSKRQSTRRQGGHSIDHSD